MNETSSGIETLKQVWEDRLNAANERVFDAQQEADACKGMLAMIDQLGGVINVKDLGNLIDLVDRLSKRISDLESKLGAKERVGEVREKVRRETIESHVGKLMEILREQRRQFDVVELKDLLGTDHIKTIQVMRTAAATTNGIRLSQGKRRKLYVSYVPEVPENGLMNKASA